MEFADVKAHIHAHHSDPPMIDAKIVAKDATRNSDFHSDEHHSDPPERVFNEVKLCSNLTNPCFALALDHRCYPYLVPWTEMIWLFKFLMCMNSYCTPHILFHRWKIKIGIIQVSMMTQIPIDDEKKNDSISSYGNYSIASENKEAMVIRKMQALMFLRIWKILASLTRKLSQTPAQERNGSNHNCNCCLIILFTAGAYYFSLLQVVTAFSSLCKSFTTQETSFHTPHLSLS